MFISLHIELPLPHDRSCIELFPPLAPGRLDVDLRSVAASSLCVPRLPRPPFLLAPARLLVIRSFCSEEREKRRQAQMYICSKEVEIEAEA